MLWCAVNCHTVPSPEVLCAQARDQGQGQAATAPGQGQSQAGTALQLVKVLQQQVDNLEGRLAAQEKKRKELKKVGCRSL